MRMSVGRSPQSSVYIELTPGGVEALARACSEVVPGSRLIEELFPNLADRRSWICVCERVDAALRAKRARER